MFENFSLLSTYPQCLNGYLLFIPWFLWLPWASSMFVLYCPYHRDYTASWYGLGLQKYHLQLLSVVVLCFALLFWLCSLVVFIMCCCIWHIDYKKYVILNWSGVAMLFLGHTDLDVKWCFWVSKEPHPLLSCLCFRFFY